MHLHQLTKLPVDRTPKVEDKMCVKFDFKALLHLTTKAAKEDHEEI